MTKPAAASPSDGWRSAPDSYFEREEKHCLSLQGQGSTPSLKFFSYSEGMEWIQEPDPLEPTQQERCGGMHLGPGQLQVKTLANLSRLPTQGVPPGGWGGGG